MALESTARLREAITQWQVSEVVAANRNLPPETTPPDAINFIKRSNTNRLVSDVVLK